MPIPESQLSTWSNLGAQDASRLTHEQIRSALDAYSWPNDVKFDSYLQGSYRNSTNIRGDSDVDLVAELSSTFYYDLDSLSEPTKSIVQRSITPSQYSWQLFRRHVIEALENYFGSWYVHPGNKAVKLQADPPRLAADVVVCASHRKYTAQYSWIYGIQFWTQREGRAIVNYPKLHYDNGVTKNDAASGRFKRTVRMFKNARNYLEMKGRIDDSLAPSYFIECLIYNASNWRFDSSLQSTYESIVNWIITSELNGLLCQNHQQYLFGSSPEQWSVTDAKALGRELQYLWNNWYSL